MTTRFLSLWAVLLCLALSSSVLAAPTDEAPAPPLIQPAPAPAEEPAPAQEPPPAAPRPPQVRVLSQRVTERGELLLEVEALSPTGVPLKIDALLDGKAASGVVITQARGLAQAEQLSVTVPLPARDCVLTLRVADGTAVSAPVLLRLRHTGRAAALETRPKLFVLAIGVGRYQSRDIPKLTYPAKDAQDLAAALRAQRPNLYREVEARVLVDEGARRADILAALRWLEQSVTREDTATLFLAGHGMNDLDGSYHYLPQDAEAKKESMLAGADLQAALQRIKGRVVLFLDTCHSGNVLGARSLNRLLAELANENRVVVFAASTGDQTSRESPSWRNGAFTKAVVEGLRGVADYTEDGAVSLSELETFVGERVKGLTSSAQTPTLAKPNATPDYMLAALPTQGVLPNPKQVLRRKLLFSTLAAGAGLAIILGGVLGARPWQGGPAPIDLTFR